MSAKEARDDWGLVDFTPVVDVERVLDHAGCLMQYEYRFFSRKRAQILATEPIFAVRGPIEDEDRTYSYEPLAEHPDQIRIAMLQPGTGLDPLRCTITVHDLNDVRDKYVCLSHVWGAYNGSHPMHLDDGIILVTANMMAALWHIRHENDPVFFWVGFLCINQSDPDENTRQGRILHHIYSGASTLISWLGPAQTDTRSIPLDLARLANASCGWKQNDATRSRLARAFSHVNWDNLRPIFDSPYWTSVWILEHLATRHEYRNVASSRDKRSQPVEYHKQRRNSSTPKFNGPRRDYLLYGRIKITPRTIFSITAALCHSHRDPQFRRLKALIPQVNNYDSGIFQPTRWLSETVVDPMCGAMIALLKHCIRNSHDFAGSYHQSCFGFGGPRSRDRLFALSGLYKSYRLEVDYNKTDMEVVLDIAEKWVESVKREAAGPAVPFSNHGLRPELQEKAQKADIVLSWIPYGWSVLHPPKIYSDLFLSCQDESFIGKRSDRANNIRFERGPNWGRLHLRCLYRTKVQRLFQPGDDKELKRALGRRFDGRTLKDSGECPLLKWLGYDQPKPSDIQLLEQYLQDEGQNELDGSEKVVEALWVMQQADHQLGLLRDKHVFVGCGYSQPGDEVVLVEGIHCAFIVRKANERGDFVFVERANLIGIEHAWLIGGTPTDLVLV